ncbi:hypothetical protein [Nocardiopsis coralliicola]
MLRDAAELAQFAVERRHGDRRLTACRAERADGADGAVIGPEAAVAARGQDRIGLLRFERDGVRFGAHGADLATDACLIDTRGGLHGEVPAEAFDHPLRVIRRRTRIRIRPDECIQ